MVSNLTSGLASIDTSTLFEHGTTEFSYPLKRKEVEKALGEALLELAKIKLQQLKKENVND